MPQVRSGVSINEDKMNAFLGKVVGDLGASLNSVLGYIGQKLGLYEAPRRFGPPYLSKRLKRLI